MKDISRRDFLKGMLAGASCAVLGSLPNATAGAEYTEPAAYEKPTSAFRLSVLGARGSMAVSGDEYRYFGGATSCYLVEAGKERILLDAGSGLLNASPDFPGTEIILLSHVHLDHVIGLGMYSRLSRADLKTKLYVPAGSREEALRILDGLYSPPYWPLGLTELGGNLEIEPFCSPVHAGDVTIEGKPGSHPGGCMAYRLTFSGKSLVYLTDYEHDNQSFPALTEFARDTDLLLYDGQYTPEEYERNRGFGHSTAEKGLEMMKNSGAKKLMLIHHDPFRTDDELRELDRKIGKEDVHFARQGECVSISF